MTQICIKKIFAESIGETIYKNLSGSTIKSDLRDYLLSTENKILVETSPYDKIWGIGLGQESQDALIPEKWNGINLLGFALMEVRDQLR